MAPTPWPYHPSDVKNAGLISIPNHLEQFLAGIITGDPDNKNQTQRVTTLLQSFSRDMIYAVTRGQHKPPKHLLFPYEVKTLTRNVEIIQTLNKLGHGVSYSKLEENDTALCLQNPSSLQVMSKHFSQPGEHFRARDDSVLLIPAMTAPNLKLFSQSSDNMDKLAKRCRGQRGALSRRSDFFVWQRLTN